MSSLGPWFGGGRRDFIPFGSPFSSDIWDPFGYGGGLSCSRGDLGDDVSALAHANVDWRETDNAHIFRVDLSGVNKADIKVQVEDNNILEITGDRIKEEEQVNDKWHRVERCRGSFRRRFRLPENANVDEVNCGLDNGVHTVTVPKKQRQEVQRNVRYIDVA
ncbi:hypothetical protein ACH5RR_034455 [Cinchona calisaya]|uniref:SHSP domain-containing protein n=1 Tax=Cinchona calisaya TaxID=153742 RepID=A0ABD2YAY5_9GENT